MALNSAAVLGHDAYPWLSPFSVSRFKPSIGARRGLVCYGAATRSESRRVVDAKEVVDHVSRSLQKDLSSFPRPLSVADLSFATEDGKKLRISFKGLRGSYSEEAALKAYTHCETVPCEEFEDAFKAVELWIADKAILPIESSFAGSIHRNYDLLLRHRLHIVGEVQLAVNFCLMAMPDVRKEQLKRVLSHPQALDCCEIFLNKLGVTRENVNDAAGAAQYVALNELRDVGVVACARASEIYGLSILAENIQVFPSGDIISYKKHVDDSFLKLQIFSPDDSDGVTRFLVLARDPIIPRTDKPYKTSIVFTLEEGPGVLFKVLAVFALRGINLTKIESRPQRNRPLRVVDDSNTGTAKYFDYLFYIDFEASMADPRAQNALGHLQEYAPFLRVLGCYPVDTTKL